VPASSYAWNVWMQHGHLHERRIYHAVPAWLCGVDAGSCTQAYNLSTLLITCMLSLDSLSMKGYIAL